MLLLADVAIRSLISIACSAAVFGCDPGPGLVDPFPIQTSRDTGPIVLMAETSDGLFADLVVVDVLSAFTVFDTSTAGMPLPDPRQRRVELTLLGLGADGEFVPRALFSGTHALDTHPCGAEEVCLSGLEGDTQPIRGIVGADVLSRNAVVFDFPARTITFSPDIAGSDRLRGEACEAVVNSPFAGGGTLLVAGAEVNYKGLRPAFGACFDVNRSEELTERGVDALLLISTGIDVSVLSASSWNRYAEFAGLPIANELPSTLLHLPSGPLAARLGEISTLTLIGDESDERGPCGELYANRVLRKDLCNADGDDRVSPCPCSDNRTFCRAGAAIDIDKSVQFAVIADDEPFLQALRDELRPELPEVDGILGVDALTELRIAFDYPNGRALLECLDPALCTTRQMVGSQGGLAALELCDEEEADAGPVP